MTELVHDEWFWREFGITGQAGVYIYDVKKVMGHDQHYFLHVDTKSKTFVSLLNESIRCRTFVVVGEAILHAQQSYLN